MHNLEVNNHELKNILSVYWQMLQELECKTNPKRDILNKIMIEGAYTVLNRIGYTPHRPSWE